MYFNFSNSYIVISRTNFAKKKSARREKKFYLP